MGRDSVSAQGLTVKKRGWRRSSWQTGEVKRCFLEWIPTFRETWTGSLQIVLGFTLRFILRKIILNENRNLKIRNGGLIWKMIFFVWPGLIPRNSKCLRFFLDSQKNWIIFGNPPHLYFPGKSGFFVLPTNHDLGEVKWVVFAVHSRFTTILLFYERKVALWRFCFRACLSACRQFLWDGSFLFPMLPQFLLKLPCSLQTEPVSFRLKCGFVWFGHYRISLRAESRKRSYDLLGSRSQ